MMPETLNKKAQAVIMALCALFALIMVMDYGLGGKTLVEEIIAINKSLEKYYNAGGNSHYSFSIQTENHDFPVPESFASLAKVGQELKIEVSPFFSEVNSSEILETEHKEVSSLRVLSGLVLPILVLLVLAIGCKYGRKVATLVFVMEAVTVANLIFLLN